MKMRAESSPRSRPVDKVGIYKEATLPHRRHICLGNANHSTKSCSLSWAHIIVFLCHKLK